MAVATTLSTLAATRQLLNEAGVQELVYEDFYTEVVALVEGVVKPNPQTGLVLTFEELLKLFRDPQGELIHNRRWKYNSTMSFLGQNPTRS